MNFRFASFKPFIVLAVVAAVWRVEAQQNTADSAQSEQAIIFSAPQNSDDAASRAPSLSPQNSAALNLPNALTAPQNVFNFNPQTSLPPPAVSSAAAQLEMQNARKDWMLMTPAEIMGVATPEKMMESSGQSAGLQNFSDQVGRFLQKQTDLRTGATNNSQNLNPELSWDFSGDRGRQNWLSGGQSDRFFENPQALQNWQFNHTPTDGQQANQNQDSDSDSFATAKTVALSASEQQAMSMQRLEQLLNPTLQEQALSSDATPKSAADNNFFNTSQPLPNSNLQPQPVVSPLGLSPASLNDAVNKPTSLTPLPGLLGQEPVKSTATPSWTPQPPPWLSTTPQPFVIPQRNF